MKILHIDRSRPFNVTRFMRGRSWIIAEQDRRALNLSEVDLTKVQLKDFLKRGEASITDAERRLRIKKGGYIRLDAKIVQTLTEKPHLIPKSWAGRWIIFDGTTLRDRNQRNSRCVLVLREGAYGWHITTDFLEGETFHPSAVLVGRLKKKSK